MKRVALVAFDDFTDIDLFLPWDLFNRVGRERCQVDILAPTKRIKSTTGLVIDVHGPLELAAEADAVYFCSGFGSRALADGPLLSAIRLDEQRQVLAAIDSGAILLGQLGLLRNRKATTYPAADLHERLVASGARPTPSPLVVQGNVATAAQCLAAVDLVRWVLARLFGDQVADEALSSAMPLPGVVEI